MCRVAYFLLLFTGLLHSGISQAQWRSEKCPTKNNLNAIAFYGINSGWIVGNEGTLLKKSIGGWVLDKKPTQENLYSVFMIEENDVWAVGAKGTIIHFNGIDWEIFDSPTKKDLFSVSFKDSKEGIAVGEYGTIIGFSNGKWNLIESEIIGNLFTATISKNEAWIGGGLEFTNVPIMKMLINDNSNELFNSMNSYLLINSIAFLNPNFGWAVGSPSVILHFDGQRWERVNVDDRYPSLKSVFFSDENNGIIVGYMGTIMIYTDNMWVKDNTEIDQDLQGTAIVENTYYAVGDSGTIISKKLPVNEMIVDKSNKTSGNLQFYPNPCSDYLSIVLPNSIDYSSVQISVININGQPIIQRNFSPKNENLTFQISTKGIEQGIYYLKVITGCNNIVVCKFIKQ
jgi:photosystem II stability/assembly factor-like uncharacterized protein